MEVSSQIHASPALPHIKSTKKISIKRFYIAITWI